MYKKQQTESKSQHEEKLKDLKQLMSKQQPSQPLDVNVTQRTIPNYP